MTAPVIEARKLSKSYHTEGAVVPSLREIDLAVAPGELLVLMGSSGSGKSTLLYLISGLERATSGEIHCAGEPVHALDETALSLLRRTGIGFVFQAINLVPHLTLLENVIIAGYLVDDDRAAVDRRARELLDSFGIGHLADRLPAQVSGGEQQRAAIARALINSPRVILADEPTGALNSAAGTAVLESFRKVNEAGQTILMATHEVRSACIADRILFLRDGAIRGEFRLAGSNLSGEEREAAVLRWLLEQGW